MMCYIWLDTSSSKPQFMGSYSYMDCSHTATDINVDSQFCSLADEHTVCLCVCVCVCVCVSVWCILRDITPMHCIATSVKEVKILTVNIPVGPLVILCLNVSTKSTHATTEDGQVLNI